MKNLILTFALLLIGSSAIAQDWAKWVNYEFEDEAAYAKAEPEVLLAANYLFENPVDKDDIRRDIAVRAVLLWMEGTPDYTFEITEEAMDLVKGKDTYFSMYLAGLTKTALENEGDPLTTAELHEQVQGSPSFSNAVLVRPARYIEDCIRK